MGACNPLTLACDGRVLERQCIASTPQAEAPLFSQCGSISKRLADLPGAIHALDKVTPRYPNVGRVLVLCCIAQNYHWLRVKCISVPPELHVPCQCPTKLRVGTPKLSAQLFLCRDHGTNSGYPISSKNSASSSPFISSISILPLLAIRTTFQAPHPVVLKFM